MTENVKSLKTCFLSGLEIPNGEYSIDHFVAKFWLPQHLYNMKQNKVPAIKIMNFIKGTFMPCEWYDRRYELCEHALLHWNLTARRKGVIISALDRFATEKEPFVPCQYCILSSKAQEYCYARRDLERYRRRWLYSIEQRECQK